MYLITLYCIISFHIICSHHIACQLQNDWNLWKTYVYNNLWIWPTLVSKHWKFRGSKARWQRVEVFHFTSYWNQLALYCISKTSNLCALTWSCRCVLRGLHGSPGDQPNRNRTDCSSGPQAGSAATRPPLGEVPGPGKSSGSLLHPQKAPLLCEAVVSGFRAGPLQGKQLRDG